LTGLNSLALILSIIMSWHYLKGGSMVGCGGGSPCEQVLNSRWSTIAGVLPISGLAVGIYLALLVASLFVGPKTEVQIRHLAWKVMLILAGTVTGSAIWFTILQKWVIGEFCPYCMTTHITGVGLAALIIWRAIAEFENYSINVSQKHQAMTKKNILPAPQRRIIRPLHAVGLALIGFVLAGSLAAFQVVFTPPVEHRDGESQNKLLPVIDYHTVPMVGSPDAPYVVTLLFDYQCPHCQRLHFSLDEVIRHYSGKVAFALAPVPLNPHCNQYIPQEAEAFKNSCELARIGLAVWVAKRDAFSSFENWMFSFESGSHWRPRTLEATMAKAVELVGQAKFDAAMTNPWLEQYLQTCIQIYGKTIQNGRGGVPKLIFGSRWIIPETYSADDLILILQNNLSVPKP
jgi:uncharacterized membrane protein